VPLFLLTPSLAPLGRGERGEGRGEGLLSYSPIERDK